MPLLIKQYIEEDCLLGIWNITETFDELISKVTLQPEELEIMNSFGNEPRKIEWLSVRVLLRELAEKDLMIIYNDNNKPFIQGNTYQISISHSHNLSSILLSKKRKVGIDLEYMSQRINKIANKFINENEAITTDEALRRTQLYIYWCAKEALYKICDKQGINFKTHLTIEPFEPQDNGVLTGYVHNIFWDDKFKLHYFKFDNYIIVYTTK
ncbi:MAG: 4'-phosphopantetheinyl transferase superfamily protein [Bacteroidales bacterium]